MKTIYKLKSETIIEMNDGENSRYKKESFHTNLTQLKRKLKDRLGNVEYNDYKYDIYIEGSNEFTFEDSNGKVTIKYHSIQRIKANRYL